MSKFRANYILIVLLALLFSVAYSSQLSSVVLVISLLLPVFTFLLMWVNYFTLSVKIGKMNILAEKKERFNVDVELKNSFLLPAVPVKIFGNFSDTQTGMITKLSIFVNVFSFSKVKIPIKNEFKYRGMYVISVDYVEVYDLLKIFNVKKRVKLNCDVIVIPRRIDLDHIENESSAQSDKPNHCIGNDVNNLSYIREFRDGDTLRNIHWKLTAKQDELMVKQYEDDENAGVVIFCDLNCYYGDDDLNYAVTDSVIEIGLALSNRLITDSYRADVVFKSEKSDSLDVYSVSNHYEYNQLFYRLSTMPITPDILAAEEMLRRYTFSEENAGAVYVVSPVLNGMLAQTLDNMNKFIRGKIIFVCADYANTDKNIIASLINAGVEIWDVDINNIKQSINYYLNLL